MHGTAFVIFSLLLLNQIMVNVNADDEGTGSCDSNGGLFTEDKTKHALDACINGVTVPMPCSAKTCVVSRPKKSRQGPASCITLCRNPAALSSTLPADCTAVYKKGTHTEGVYRIHPDPSKVAFQAPCDGKGWTVIQRRFDGSVDFYRTWTEYKNGFDGNDLKGELWLGLDKIYQLTNRVNAFCRLRIDVEYFDNSKLYAEYKSFYVENEDDHYRLRVSGYSGNAGDAFINPKIDFSGWYAHDGMAFFTHDRNKGPGQRCAKTYESGWWFNGCFDANLNGMYSPNSTCLNYHLQQGKCICWHLNGFKHEALKASTMKIFCE